MNNIELENIKWQGFKRKNGKIGIRNKILVIYTVECASFVAKEIARISNDKNIDVVGFSGCTDNDYAIRLLISLIRHPNIGAVLAVGLGCEYVQPEKLSNIAKEEEKITDWLFIQNEGGTKKAISKGLDIIKKMQEDIKNTERIEMGFSDLIIGAECGGSDYTSGLAGNTVVGAFNDKLVDNGGIAVFEEIVEAVGLIDLLKDRAVNEEVKNELVRTYDKAMEYCKSVHQYSISPGNFVGGLSTIEEKSMGAVVKSGSRKIEGVLKVGEQVKKKGLWLLDTTPDPHFMQFGITNPNDNEGIIDLISVGAHIVFLVTGRGNVVGSAVSPVIKITGNHNTYEKMIDDMDFDASPMLYEANKLSELTDDLIKLVIDVSSGMETKAEKLGHKEYFIPYKYQDLKCKENNN